ncbi:MAG: hypothetical protein HY313_10720 [Acidobacteria bacterium]|nr:hypothetical protein [Acidobacteriota bacterium]
MEDNPLRKLENESFVFAGHTLKSLFEELVGRNFREFLKLSDAEIIEYLAGLLTQFSQAENLYAIRNARGKPIEDVAEMLLVSNPLLEAPSFDREREVRKHIGDFTLFFTGIFPEAINRWRLRRQHLDSLIDYVKAGKESYFIVSKFNVFEYKDSAPFFRKMSDQFETCVFGLNLVKQDLERMQQAAYVRAQELLS